MKKVVLICLFLGLFECGIIMNVTSLDQVQDSGDNYPTMLPILTQQAPFKGKSVLFALSHGVEDHEVYYVHQYFVSRGATVTFGCAYNDTMAVLSDFVKPSYLVKCVFLDTLGDLSSFDAVYVPGGVPSSSAIRTNTKFIQAMRKYWINPDNNSKLLAIICSGTESLIDAQMLLELPAIVGSPASLIPLERGYQAIFKPASNYKGNDDLYSAISYPSNYFSSPRASLVLGKNPSSSQQFVTSIGNTWMNLQETAPSNGEGVPLWWKDDKYNHPDLTPITTLDQLPVIDDPVPSFTPLNLKGLNVGIAISSGAHSAEVLFLNQFFMYSEANVNFICPWWNPIYKDGQVYLHSDPPAQITHVAKCSYGFPDVSNGKLPLDIIVVPGGLFSTGGVLRNDYDLISLLNSHWRAKKGILVIGTGVQTLIPANVAPGKPVVAPVTAQRDVLDAGYTLLQSNYAQMDDKIIIFSDIYSFNSNLIKTIV